MKKALIKIFQNLLVLLGQHRSKHLLWGSLAKVMKQSYNHGGEGEAYILTTLSKIDSELSIIDVGANVGSWSVDAAKILPGSKIYAIEAIPEFFNKIDSSMLVEKYNLALSDREETLQIFQSGGGAKPLAKNTEGKKIFTHQVRAITGDQFIEENNIEKVDFIKIDTDGFDFPILNGFSDTIERHQPIVQFELSHWWLSLGYTIKLAEKFFLDKNYSLFVMKSDSLGILSYDIPDSLFICANIVAIPNSLVAKIKEFQQNM